METNNSHKIIVDVSQVSVVSKDVLFVFQVINFIVVNEFFAVFGTIANIINAIVFAKIGFKDTINVSLFALAIADFGVCLTVIFWNKAMNPWFNELNLPFYPGEALYVLAGWPHMMFSKVTIVITSFVAFERCLCVAMPLKVKSIITGRRVRIFIICAYILVLGAHVPVFYTSRLAWRFDPSRNKSILGVYFSPDREEIEAVVLTLYNVLFSFIPFVILISSTTLLVIHLRKKSIWRQAATTATKSNEVSQKEKKVAKMVIIICTLFLSCFIPTVTFVVTMTLDPEISVTGKKSNLFGIFSSFGVVLQTINSAMNIAIYYHNSSAYNAMLKHVFQLKRNAVTSKK